MLMNMKKQNAINRNRILSRNMEYLRHFKTLLLFSKLILLIFRFFVFINRASRICSCSLLILCTIIGVFSTRIIWNLDLGIERVLRCKAMELESLRCIVNLLERVVVVRPTYALFSWETVSPKRHFYIYTCKQPLLDAYERFESARDNFGKFIHQFQTETKTLIKKLERILIKLYRQNVSLFNQTGFYYIYMCVCVCFFFSKEQSRFTFGHVGIIFILFIYI